MTAYIVESYASWFIVETNTKREAFSEGVKEFGRGNVQSVARASQSDIDYFINVKGKDAMQASRY